MDKENIREKLPQNWTEYKTDKRCTDRQTHRQRDRQTDRQINEEMDFEEEQIEKSPRQTDRQTDMHTETYRQTDRQIDEPDQLQSSGRHRESSPRSVDTWPASAWAVDKLNEIKLNLGICIAPTQSFRAALGAKSSVCCPGNTADRQTQWALTYC
jgi:hypothetical protein